MRKIPFLLLGALLFSFCAQGTLWAQAKADVIICVEEQRIELPGRLHAKVFDTAVNTGVSRANKILQQAINDANPGAGLKVDGVIGPKSRAALCGLSESELLRAYAQRQAAFYKGIAARKPSQNKFLKGWLRRAAWIPE